MDVFFFLFCFFLRRTPDQEFAIDSLFFYFYQPIHYQLVSRNENLKFFYLHICIHNSLFAHNNINIATFFLIDAISCVFFIFILSIDHFQQMYYFAFERKETMLLLHAKHNFTIKKQHYIKKNQYLQQQKNVLLVHSTGCCIYLKSKHLRFSVEN